MRSGTLSLTHRPWLTVALVSLGVFLASLDQTVVVTVLPQVMLDMRVPPTKLDQVAWIVTGYLLGYTVAIPLMARLADVYGHARVFRVALLLFAASSAVVALSPNLPWLVTSRMAQALGGGATIPVGMALATGALPLARRALAVGVIGAAAEAGVVLGPLYGGGVTAMLDWRWVFWLNLPLVALLLWLLRAIPQRRTTQTRVDYPGGLLLAGGLTLLVMALAQRDAFAVSSATPFLLGVLGLLALGGLVWVEGRVSQPLLSGLLFRSRVALSAMSTKLLMGAALIIAMVTVPLMADTVLGQSPLEGGLRLMRLTGALPVGAVLGGLLAYRVGARNITLAGLSVAATGLFLMSGWGLNIADPQMTAHLALAGFGFGLVIAPIFMTAVDAGGAEYLATSASLVTVARMMGMALGMAALSAWGMEQFQGLTAGLDFPLPLAGETEAAFSARFTQYQAQTAQASISLFQSFFRGAAILLLAALAPALGMGSRRRVSREGSLPPPLP